MKPLEDIRPRKKCFLDVRIHIGCVEREMGEIVNIYVFNPSYTFRGPISKS